MSDQVKYRIFPSILDAYGFYLNNYKKGDAYGSLIAKINRIAPRLEQAIIGQAFNDIIDKGLFYPSDSFVEQDGFSFPANIVNHYCHLFRGTNKQVFTVGNIETRYGLVNLYGFIDYLSPHCIYDLKTTAKYFVGKYKNNTQHLVYSFCLDKLGSPKDFFSYRITDFIDMYVETYAYNAKDTERMLRRKCEDFIEFLEANRHLITDKKIFNLQQETA